MNKPCACGCGGQTRGEYLLGHRPIKMYRSRDGKRLHVGRAEAALGRPLPPKAEVHHLLGGKGDDEPLVICPDHGYHMTLHARMRVKAAGGNPDADGLCSTCHRVVPQSLMTYKRQPFSGRCRECRRVYVQWLRQQGRLGARLAVVGRHG